MKPEAGGDRMITRQLISNGQKMLSDKKEIGGKEKTLLILKVLEAVRVRSADPHQK